ncbi:MAG: methionine adenosyltransferase [Candidatus Nanohalobium sp.]
MKKGRITTEKTEDPVQKAQVEIVERKGLGHPDSICDGIAEKVSQALSREYREKFGKVLHHNTDEVQLVAGKSDPEFGGGKIQEKIYLLLTGRATKNYGGQKIPVDKIAVNAAEKYIEDCFKALTPDNFEIESRIGETSSDLKNVFKGEVPRSNDTSFGTGHAPLSPVEKTVKTVEENVRQVERFGEDVKVMAVKEDQTLEVTVAAAGISNRIKDVEEYREGLEKVRNIVESEVEKEGFKPEVHVNTADSFEEGSVYLTETGTSAENGDDGSVGRGNRVNGLITPNRPMSLEAASGKNPVTHVGKIYNILAGEIAKEIFRETGKFAEVKIVSQIGEKIDRPRRVAVKTGAGNEEVEEAVEKHLNRIPELCESMINGEHRTF